MILPATAQTCDKHLTLDQRYERLESHQTMAMAMLINEANYPVIAELHHRVLSNFTGAFIHDISTTLTYRANSSGSISRLLMQNPYGFDTDYETFWVSSKYSLHCPCTAYNRSTMRKLANAVGRVKVQLMEAIEAGELPESFEGRRLLRERSFAAAQVVENFRIAGETVLNAAAQLTSDPVDELTSDQLLRRICSDPGDEISLIVKFALKLAPAVLGRYGPSVYLSNPLVMRSNQICFSPHFIEFLRNARREFLRKNPDLWELGHGCPIAHKLSDHRQSGFQLYIDAVMHAYALGSDS